MYAFWHQSLEYYLNETFLVIYDVFYGTRSQTDALHLVFVSTVVLQRFPSEEVQVNVYLVKIPPLRERIKDIPLLIEHFLKIYSKKYNKEKISINKDAKKKIVKYHFPGNVRELQHIIERAVIMCESTSLTPNDFLLKSGKAEKEVQGDFNIEEVEKNAIKNALRKHEGNVSKAAKELGLGRTTLYRKMTKYGF